MRNLMLIARREYLERVRTKSFLLSTVGLPLVMAVAMLLPQKLATMRSGTARHIVVAANAEVGASVKRTLERGYMERTLNESDLQPGEKNIGTNYKVDIDTTITEDERKVLTERVGKGEIDGFLWIPDEALAARKVSYSGRELSDFMDVSAVRSAVTDARMEQQMSLHGIAPDTIKDLLQDVRVDTIRIEKGKATKTSTTAGFLTAFVLVMLLYVTLLLYGVSIMRAVLEEKTSRVMEVLLSTVTSRDLMMGKIFGVGCVGMTQILIWITLVMAVGAPAAASSGLLKNVTISPIAVIAFAVFFLLGYLLYSAIYAAIGAMVNSEQEGQQFQIIGMSPLIVAISLMMLVVRQPNSPVAMWMSMVPFFAPILMYLRIAVQPPPMWQIAACIVLLMGTIWGVMVLAGRIYRIGVLMYGKRPTLPEILKWIKYA